ncbi:MAG: fibronectin type III domain-containing protein [Eubacterium sp.]|nr:fibronectin type III domain-containing protein [Eubacterium sp.]
MKIKRCMAFVLSAVLTVAGLPVSATAAPTDANGEIGRNQEIVYVEPAQETEDLLGNLPGNGELFQMYVDGLFFGNPSVSVYGDFGAQKLEGLNLEAYRHLKEKIHQIAMGEAASSQITITLEELGITKREWTAEELGVASIVTDKAITQEAVNALSKLISPDLRTVLNYLLVDCPWDLYWYDKTAPTGSSSGMSVKATNTDGTWLLYLPEDFTGFTYDFPVAAEYRASSENLYSVNTDLVQSAKTAAENAKQIVRENAGLNDFQKLTAYKDKICELVSYNHQAVDTNAAYGNPWQLIWVFDGNPDTGVVCEGYSKAFQYLCDLSDFNNSSVACYTVTGIMNGGTGAGGHMWNIATMGNGKNYIVDVTNCDTDTIGAPDHLFLAGASGGVSGGYAVSIPGGNVTIRYEYDNGHPEMYGDVLNISDTDYVYDPSHEDNCPNHHLDSVAERPASCTEDGNIAYYICQACQKVYSSADGTGEIRVEDTVAPALGHNYGTEWDSSADTHYHVCSRCQDRADEAEHVFEWVTDTEPTETTAGTRHEECSVCGRQGRQETIDPLPHEHTYSEVYESDETGHWKICEACQSATETEAHEYGDWTVKKEGSCTEPGQEARTCGTCGYEETREIGARHEIEAIQAKEPTCTEAGNQAYFSCKNCGQVFEDEEGKNAAEQEAFEIPATGHDYGTEWGSDETGHYHICKTCNEKTGAEEHTFRWIVDIEPTETTEGTRHEECSVCGYRGREETIEKPLPHDHEYGESYESDETGHWKICEVCQKATETEAHEYGDWTVKKEGSCTEPGQEARACGTCGYEETREIGARHEIEAIQAKEPTCTEAGNRAYFSCKNCGQVFEDEEGKNAAEQEAFEIPATGHKYGEWIIDSPQTCTQPGTRHRVCSMCDYVDTGYIAADGHDWEEYYGIDVPATCTTSGSQSRSCKSCGETDVKVIPAAGHSMKKTEAKEATCTETGNVEYYTCLACRKIFLDAQGEQEATETGIINTPKISHLYEIITTSATTERDGSSYRKCTVCGSVAETQAIFCPQTVTLSYVTCTYNGKAKKPSVTVYDRKGNVISPESYTVSYSKNKNVGTAVVRVVFQGNYSGIVTRTFAIRTKGTTILKLKSVSKGFTVTWKKNKNQTTGYQIQYAANKNFKGAKVKTYEGVTKATVVKLKAKKKYYVRIRTYKKVDGVRIYSDWSKAKSVKTKR